MVEKAEDVMEEATQEAPRRVAVEAGPRPPVTPLVAAAAMLRLVEASAEAREMLEAGPRLPVTPLVAAVAMLRLEATSNFALPSLYE